MYFEMKYLYLYISRTLWEIADHDELGLFQLCKLIYIYIYI